MQVDGPNVYPGVPHDYTKEVSCLLHACMGVNILKMCFLTLRIGCDSREFSEDSARQGYVWHWQWQSHQEVV